MKQETQQWPSLLARGPCRAGWLSDELAGFVFNHKRDKSIQQQKKKGTVTYPYTILGYVEFILFYLEDTVLFRSHMKAHEGCAGTPKN